MPDQYLKNAPKGAVGVSFKQRTGKKRRVASVKCHERNCGATETCQHKKNKPRARKPRLRLESDEITDFSRPRLLTVFGTDQETTPALSTQVDLDPVRALERSETTVPHGSVSQSPPDSWAARVAGKSRPVELEEHVPVLVAVRSPSRAGKRVQSMSSSFHPDSVYWQDLDGWVDVTELENAEGRSAYDEDPRVIENAVTASSDWSLLGGLKTMIGL